MNLVQLQDQLKNFSQQQLVTEMQRPSGQMPQFLILTELNRRKRMMDQQQVDAAQGDQQSVAQDLVAAAGMPAAQAGQLSRALAPGTDMAGNTGLPQAPQPQAPMQRPPMPGGPGGPVMMREGGIIALREGRLVRRPQVVVRNGRQFAQMADGSLIPLSDLGFSAADLGGAGTENLANPFARPPSPAAGGSMGMGSARAQGLDTGIAMPMMGFAAADDLTGRDTLPAMLRADRTGMPAGIAALTAPASTAPGQRPAYAPANWQPDPAVGSPPERDPSGIQLPWWMSVDPNAAPGEGLERFLFPNRDPEEIRRRRSSPAAPEDVVAPIPDAQDEREQAPPATPAAPTVGSGVGAPSGGGGGTGGGGGGGGGGAAGSAAPGSFEEFIQQRIQNAEADRRRDQWLSLAQFGLQLMASDSPTLGGAIGEAGSQALESLRGSYQSYNDTMMDLYGTREQLRARRAGAGGGGGAPTLGGLSTDQARLLGQYETEIGRLDTILGGGAGALTPAIISDSTARRDALISERQMLVSAMSGVPFGALSTASNSFDVR